MAPGRLPGAISILREDGMDREGGPDPRGHRGGYPRAVAISPETMWILVTSGLLAHADGVLDGEECELLLARIEDEADPEEYSAWLSTIADVEALRRLMDGLPEPDPQQHRELLRQAWSMAMVDGEQCEAERAALAEIAGRLGVEPVQLDFWREAWDAQARTFASHVAHAMGWVLGGDGPVYVEDRTILRDAVGRLPTTTDHREELLAEASIPASREEVAPQLAALPRPRRVQALRLLAALAAAASRPDETRARLLELAERIGIPQDRAEQLLARAQ